MHRIDRDRILGNSVKNLRLLASWFVSAKPGEYNYDISYSMNVCTVMAGPTSNELIVPELRCGWFGTHSKPFNEYHTAMNVIHSGVILDERFGMGASPFVTTCHTSIAGI